MKKVEKISGLNLSELLVMYSRMIDELDRFNHVGDDISDTVKVIIFNEYNKLCAEYERRENLNQ